MRKSTAPASPVTSRRKFLHRALWVTALVGFALLVKFILHQVMPRNFNGNGEPLPLVLPHGTYQTLYFSHGKEPPRGIVIFATGDGGWSCWEEKVAQHLARCGYAVGGWDCRKFADSRTYDQAELSAGFLAAVEQVRRRSAAPANAPVFYGGWSTGAEQSLAAAAFKRPPHLVGLLLVAPGRHGRYGITESDLLGMEPDGDGSFALADLAPHLTGLSIHQFAAGLDPLDDTSWLENLPNARVTIHPMPNHLHDMGGADDDFLAELDAAIVATTRVAGK